MTHDLARALAEAGLMPPAEYLRLCRVNGWLGQARPLPRLIIDNT